MSTFIKNQLRTLLALVIAGALFGCGDDDDKKSCTDGDKTYHDGDEWRCSDGCNTCTCEDGSISSTLIECAGS